MIEIIDTFRRITSVLLIKKNFFFQWFRNQSDNDGVLGGFGKEEKKNLPDPKWLRVRPRTKIFPFLSFSINKFILYISNEIYDPIEKCTKMFDRKIMIE